MRDVFPRINRNPGVKAVFELVRVLEIRDNTLIACILRNGMTIIPGGNDVIKLNDRVIVAAKNGNIQDLRDILK